MSSVSLINGHIDEVPDKRQEYIDYFTHMQAEHKRIPLGGMAWQDINWWVYNAIYDGSFTAIELADMFPDLLGWLKEA